MNLRRILLIIKISWSISNNTKVSRRQRFTTFAMFYISSWRPINIHRVQKILWNCLKTNILVFCLKEIIIINHGITKIKSKRRIRIFWHNGMKQHQDTIII